MVATTGEEEFIVQLDETSEEEHLDLADSRNGVPGLDTLGRDGGKRGAVRKLSGETEAGANGPPADEGGHGNASVLDLGVTEPGNGLIRSKFGETEGIPNRSELDAIRRSEGSFTGLAGGGDRGGGFERLGHIYAHDNGHSRLSIRARQCLWSLLCRRHIPEDIHQK